MSDIIDKLEKKFGEGIFVRKDEEISVIPTGSLSLDVSLGIGGIPRRRITVIYGAESSFKTTLCIELVAEAIKNNIGVFYIDVEQTLDLNYVKAVAGDYDENLLVIAKPETAEEALQIAETAINGDDGVGIEPGEFGLVIIDSVAALAPEREKEKELTESNIALTSKTLSAFFRRNSHHIRTNNVALVMVNQVRDNIGSYTKGYVLPGGHALKHYASVILFLSSGKKVEQSGEVVGALVPFVVKKNKLSIPHRKHEIPFTYGKGINRIKDVVEFAVRLGVVKRRGAYYNFEGENLGQGMDNTCETLENSQETLDKIRELCYNSISKITIEEDD